MEEIVDKNVSNGGIIVVGGGVRGLFFVELLSTKFGREIAAIVENNIERHKLVYQCLEEMNITDVPVFKSTDEALKEIPRTKADKLFIMTPEWAHFKVFKSALEAGYHLFLEKPLATTKEDTLEILRLAKSTNRKIQVGFVLRYSPFYKKIKEIIDSGLLGKIVVIQMNERLGYELGSIFRRDWHSKKVYTGGFINEKCCHDIDLLCWFKELQAAPKEVVSYGGQALFPERDTPKYCDECNKDNCPWRFTGVNSKYGYVPPNMGKCVFQSDADVNDHQSITVIFEDDTQAIFTAIAVSGNEGRDIILHGTDGYLEGNLEKGYIRYKNYWEDNFKEINFGDLDGHGGGDEEIVSSFLKCVDEGLNPISTVEAGVRASLIAFAADESIKVGKRVLV